MKRVRAGSMVTPHASSPCRAADLDELLVRIRKRLGDAAHLPLDAGRGACTGDMR